MARAGHEEITLPWRETVDGAVAELGAVFRVELVGGKWQCSAKSGRCRTVIAKGLPSQAEGKRRAQAHAATMPEVRAATKPAAKKTASRRARKDAEPDAHASAPASRRARKDAEPDASDTHANASASRRKAAASEPTSLDNTPASSGPGVEVREPEISVESQPEASPIMTTLGVTYRTTDDGCLCGKTQGVCWVANGKEVVFARPPSQAVHDQVRDAVMQHYAAEEAAREAAEQAEREAAEQTARTEAAARTRASKAATKKAAVRKIARASKRAKPAPAKDAKPAKGRKPATDAAPAKDTKPAKDAKPERGRKAGHARASKPKTAKGKRSAAKEDAPVTVKAAETRPAARGKRSAPKDAPVTVEAAETTAKRSRKSPALPAEAPTGPIAWSDVEGKPRGVAAHGTFMIEPEGQGFALYFADASGQSRHLRSGAMPELRRAAEEYAARGEPAPLRDAPSREQDEALMRIFASGAVGA